MKRIGFNKPYFTGKEVEYIIEAVRQEKVSGNGLFTQKCQRLLQDRYGVSKVLLTSSCTDALEMCALLLNIQKGDEIIMPSFTFVSTANAFVLRGATIVFADSGDENPNIDTTRLESLISAKTKAIVVVHYAGISCNMDEVMAIAERHHLYVVEDAAQGIESTYKGRPLGSIGHLGCFSFHETKNVISGEGGALLINDKTFIQRAEILWEKGTNRSAFFRGEVDKYNWIDVGSSFLCSDITAAFLLSQLENIDNIQHRRQEIWQAYHDGLTPLIQNGIQLPSVPHFAKHNAHIFYLVCRSEVERTELIQQLDKNGVDAIFHYLSLHSSPFYRDQYRGQPLLESHRYEVCLVRLPLYFELSNEQVQHIIDCIITFYQGR